MATGKEHPLDERGERLVHDAGKIFWTYGIKSVTMDDLATRMGISKKTLYQYVKDKNDLVEKVLDHLATEFKCMIDKEVEPERNAIDELFGITLRVCERLRTIHPAIHFDLEKYHGEAFRRMMRTKQEEVFSTMTGNMERGIKEGLYRDDLNIPVIAKIYIARIDALFDGDLFPPDQFNMKDVHWELFRYHIRGIASTKGVRYLVKKVKKEHNP
ncbi:MAG: TetR/AcrR family transcriptional regulator [Flavobacteriales bacterium]|nr:TetR/AcrR family transcriptional regulator [Flavobacteriales bacterium]MEB2342220.1 TetR/AcrR family transcriptional regulator [Flavobacteriia bacterium]HRN38603.1 TetR/AcrR family transcriptional regulator [Flavobacteriales bacterium]